MYILCNSSFFVVVWQVHENGRMVLHITEPMQSTVFYQLPNNIDEGEFYNLTDILPHGIEATIRQGDLSEIQRIIVEGIERYTPQLGDLVATTYVHSHIGNYTDLAAKYGHLHIVQYLREQGIYCTPAAVCLAAREHHWRVLTDLVQNGMQLDDESKFHVLSYADVSYIKQLVETFDVKFTSLNIDAAIKRRASHWEIVALIKYLYKQGVQCTSKGADAAAITGNFELIKLLHQQGIRCTTEGADACGSLEIIKFLRKNQGVLCTKVALTRAARDGSWDIVKFLLDTNVDWAVSTQRFQNP